jgi:hypothetical protein
LSNVAMDTVPYGPHPLPFSIAKDSKLEPSTRPSQPSDTRVLKQLQNTAEVCSADNSVGSAQNLSLLTRTKESSGTLNPSPSELDDSDKFFGEGNVPKDSDITPCQQILQSPNSSCMPQRSSSSSGESGLPAAAAVDSLLSATSSQCTRKVVRLNDNPSVKSTLTSNLPHLNFMDPQHVDVRRIPQVALPSPVVKCRVDPHTQCFVEVVPSLSALHISESPASQQSRKSRSIGIRTGFVFFVSLLLLLLVVVVVGAWKSSWGGGGVVHSACLSDH